MSVGAADVCLIDCRTVYSSRFGWMDGRMHDGRIDGTYKAEKSNERFTV